MDIGEFRTSLKDSKPPRGLPPLLRALWHDAKGNWSRAHEIVQEEGGRSAARVHAYLHRKEGDSENADYWYARCGEERPRGALDQEWKALVVRYLGE
jgi:hypothetical protein